MDQNNSNNINSYYNLLIILGPTLLIIIGGIISWFIQSKYNKLREIENRLREDRRKIYSDILKPFIMVWASIKGPQKLRNEAINIITSLEYKLTAFELVLIGSDDVVRSFNKIMQHIYEHEDNEQNQSDEILKLFGELLLVIRKNLGNEKTKLDKWETMESMIKDIKSIKPSQ